jgi:GntR family transcriptional regulator, transcriptional repressor for pyruvate dehydrogenase complex
VPLPRSTKISQQVATAIVDDIVSKRLKPGDRLEPEASMVQRFGVGRASIREGLRLLETYGVISIKPGQKGGPTVGKLDASDLGRMLSLFLHILGATYRDLIETRLVIEPVMARLAAERQDPEQLAKLKEVIDFESAAPIEDYVPTSNEFHYAVNGASGNPVLDLLGQALRTMYRERLASGGLFPTEARGYVRSTHAEIGDAIFAGKADEAERLMKLHMDDLARLQSEKTPWFMDERVAWEA